MDIPAESVSGCPVILPEEAHLWRVRRAGTSRPMLMFYVGLLIVVAGFTISWAVL